MKKYQPDTQEINAAVLPTPDAFADVIAAEILFDIKKNGRIISQQLLKDSILSGLAKLDLVTIADDDGNTDDDTQGAPISLEVIRDEVLAAVAKKFNIDGNPDDPDLLNLRPAVEYAIKAVFDYYIVR